MRLRCAKAAEQIAVMLAVDIVGNQGHVVLDRDLHLPRRETAESGAFSDDWRTRRLQRLRNE